MLETRFKELDDVLRELVTSALSLLEVLVVPYRARNYLLAPRYEDLLARIRGIKVADIAALLSADKGVKTPDSL